MIDHRCPTIATPQGTVRQPVFDRMGSAVTTVGSCEPGLGRVQVHVAAIGICEARKQAIKGVAPFPIHDWHYRGGLLVTQKGSSGTSAALQLRA
jgi:hypothetical protein